MKNNYSILPFINFDNFSVSSFLYITIIFKRTKKTTIRTIKRIVIFTNLGIISSSASLDGILLALDEIEFINSNSLSNWSISNSTIDLKCIKVSFTVAGYLILNKSKYARNYKIKYNPSIIEIDDFNPD